MKRKNRKGYPKDKKNRASPSTRIVFESTDQIREIKRFINTANSSGRGIPIWDMQKNKAFENSRIYFNLEEKVPAPDKDLNFQRKCRSEGSCAAFQGPVIALGYALALEPICLLLGIHVN